MAVSLGAMMGFLAMSYSVNKKNQTIAEVDAQGLMISQIITQSIRNSSAINSPAIGVSASSLSLGMVSPE